MFMKKAIGKVCCGGFQLPFKEITCIESKCTQALVSIGV